MIVKDVLGGVVGLYFLVWLLALIELAFLGAVLLVSRGRSNMVRDLFRRSVATGGGGSIHVANQSGPAQAVGDRLAQLRSKDREFDESAFLDGARVAVGAYALASSAEDDRLLRRITTPGFWQTVNGKAIEAAAESWRRYAGERAGSTNRGRLVLDVSWRQPEITRVVLGTEGLDRMTVRLGSVTVGAVQPGWRRIDQFTRFDWEFVRPTEQSTDPNAVMLSRTCAECGAPYRSDYDDACPRCRAPRTDAQAGWRLDATYLVVDS